MYTIWCTYPTDTLCPKGVIRIYMLYILHHYFIRIHVIKFKFKTMTHQWHSGGYNGSYVASLILGIHRFLSLYAADILSEVSNPLNVDDVLPEIVGQMCMCIGQLLTNEYHDVVPRIPVVSSVNRNGKFVQY